MTGAILGEVGEVPVGGAGADGIIEEADMLS